jgi:flagellar hook-associated protein 3 FlgL
MRITNTMSANNITASLFRQTEAMYKSQEQIMTGKKINRPSDDPIGMSTALGYRNTISSLEQYEENIAAGKIHIETMDNVLEMVADLLNDAKALSFDDNPEMRPVMAAEVATIREQILDFTNYQLNGNYIFSGDATDTAPFDNTGFYLGDNNNKDLVISSSTQVTIAADGSDIFQSVTDIFAELDALETDLIAGDSALIASHTDPLDKAIDQVNAVRAVNASTFKRLEATENYHAVFKVNMQDLLSRTEDANLAEAIVNFQAQQTTYESTLASSSMIMQKSLLDFLR